MSGRCEVCGVNFPLPPNTVCHPCTTKGELHQDQDQDQGQEHVQALTPGAPCPGPGVVQGEDGPELYLLLDAWREKRLEPRPVLVGRMPVHARTRMKAISDHMR